MGEIPSYTCKPMMNFKTGPHQFKDGLYKPKTEEINADFEDRLEYLRKHNPALRNRIKTISIAAAEALIASIQPQASPGFAHSNSGVAPVQHDLNPPEQHGDVSDPPPQVPAAIESAVKPALSFRLES